MIKKIRVKRFATSQVINCNMVNMCNTVCFYCLEALDILHPYIYIRVSILLHVHVLHVQGVSKLVGITIKLR